MYLVNTQQMREMDRFTIEEIGIPGVVLMEKAGACATEEISRRWAPHVGTIVVLSGHGNNGGDGFVVARCLKNEGYDVRLRLIGRASRLSEESRIHYQAASACGVDVQVVESPDKILYDELQQAGGIVDALLGTGIRGDVREHHRQVIEWANAAPAPMASLDIPSGVHGDDGSVRGIAVRAAFTVTFAYPKWGHYLFPGAEQAGELIVRGIGIPRFLGDEVGGQSRLVDASMVRLPNRSAYSHKGTYGHALMVAGSGNMIGAPSLAAHAAVRCGAGLVTLAVPASLRAAVAAKVTEPVLWGWDEEEEHFHPDSHHHLREKESRFSCLTVGPGIGVWNGGFRWLEHLLQTYSGPVVLDADALNLLAVDPEILIQRQAPVILTPHPGEMARLVGTTTEDVGSRRLEVARAFVHRTGCHLVLKGHHTVMVTPSGREYVNVTGDASMAKGGSGDVLTGMISGLLAQGMEAEMAMVAGVYLHGLAGEISGDGRLYSNTASDMIDAISDAIGKVTDNGSSPIHGS